MIRRPQTVVWIEQKDVDTMKALRKGRLPGEPSNKLDSATDKARHAMNNNNNKSSDQLEAPKVPGMSPLERQMEQRRKKTTADRIGL